MSPSKVTENRPKPTLTVAAKSVAERRSTERQPGMHCLRISGSFIAAQTISLGAEIRSSPIRSMLFPLSLAAAYDDTSAFCQAITSRLQELPPFEGMRLAAGGLLRLIASRFLARGRSDY